MRIGFIHGITDTDEMNNLIDEMSVERWYTEFDALKNFIRSGDVIVVKSMYSITRDQLEDLKSAGVVIESFDEGVTINASVPKRITKPAITKGNESPKAQVKKKTSVNDPKVSEYIKIDDVVKELQISKWTAYQLVRSGKLKATKIGQTWLVSRKSISDYIDSTNKGLAERLAGKPKTTYPKEYDEYLKMDGLRIESFEKAKKLFEACQYEVFTTLDVKKLFGYNEQMYASRLVHRLSMAGIVESPSLNTYRFVPVNDLKPLNQVHLKVPEELLNKFSTILDELHIYTSTKIKLSKLFASLGNQPFTTLNIIGELGIPYPAVRSLMKALLRYNLVTVDETSEGKIYSFIDVSKYTLSAPSKSQYASDRYNVEDFVMQRCVLDSEASIKMTDLYAAYIEFSTATKYEYPVKNISTFAYILNRLYPMTKNLKTNRKIGTVRGGISLKDTTSDIVAEETKKPVQTVNLVEAYASIFDALKLDENIRTLANELLSIFRLNQFSRSSVEYDEECRNPEEYRPVYGVLLPLGIMKRECDETRVLYRFVDPSTFSVEDAQRKIPEFIDSECILDPDATTPFRNIYSAYLKYCQTITYDKPIKFARTFGGVLSALYPSLKTFKSVVQGNNGSRYRKGIRLKHPTSDAPKQSKPVDDDTDTKDEGMIEAPHTTYDIGEAVKNLADRSTDDIYGNPDIFDASLKFARYVYYNDKIKHVNDEMCKYLGIYGRTPMTTANTLFDIIYGTVASDKVTLTRKAHMKLLSMWYSRNQDKFSGIIPADIYINRDDQKIPIEDCIIELESNEPGKYDIFRIKLFTRVILDQLNAAIQSVPESKTEWDSQVIGAITWKHHDATKCETVAKLIYDEAGNAITIVTPFLSNEIESRTPDEWQECLKYSIKSKEDLSAIYEGLQAWYSVQIALLNPILKTCVIEDTKKVARSPDYGSKKRKSKVMYMKVKYVSEESINTALTIEHTPGKRKIVRKTMAWYVIGHYRTYKSGKRTWVRPHWRGPLRALMMPEDGKPRERVIAQVANLTA